jgi:hypothetical protein
MGVADTAHDTASPTASPSFTCHNKVPISAHAQRPHGSMVARQLQQHLPAVQVPVLDQAILARGEGIVGVPYKGQAGHRVLVSKQGAVAVAKIQAPHL